MFSVFLFSEFPSGCTVNNGLILVELDWQAIFFLYEPMCKAAMACGIGNQGQLCAPPPLPGSTQE